MSRLKAITDISWLTRLNEKKKEKKEGEEEEEDEKEK